METIADITIGTSVFGTSALVMKQDEDRIVVQQEDIEEFKAAVRKHASIVEEGEPTPEKWYVVLKNSNYRLSNSDKTPTTFTVYEDARAHARRYTEMFTKIGRRYAPISADEYERVFGR